MEKYHICEGTDWKTPFLIRSGYISAFFTPTQTPSKIDRLVFQQDYFGKWSFLNAPT